MAACTQTQSVYIPTNHQDGYFITDFQTFQDNNFNVRIDPQLMVEYMGLNCKHVNYNTIILCIYHEETSFRGSCIRGPVVKMTDIERRTVPSCCAFLDLQTNEIKPFQTIPSFLNIEVNCCCSSTAIFGFNIGKYLWHLSFNYNLNPNTTLPVVSCFGNVIPQGIGAWLNSLGKPSSSPNSFPYMSSIEGPIADAINAQRDHIYERLDLGYREKHYTFTVGLRAESNEPIRTCSEHTCK